MIYEQRSEGGDRVRAVGGRGLSGRETEKTWKVCLCGWADGSIKVKRNGHECQELRRVGDKA